MSLIFSVIVFIASLTLLVKSSDWFIESSEKIGLAFKISPFIIGVTIVAMGTSFPELASSIAATFKGATEIVSANVIGSNIANILLIIGLAAVAARCLIVQRSLIDLDAPLLAASSFLFLFILLDKRIVLGEGILLIFGFVVYLLYTIFQRKGGKLQEENSEAGEVLAHRVEKKEDEQIKEEKAKETPSQKLTSRVFILLILGMAGLILGANWTIDSMLNIAQGFNIATSLIAIIALAVGTSLPELVVSIRAAAQKKYELSLGNIFGSNVFNILFIPGICALIKPLAIDELTFGIGIPFFIASVLLFIFSGISRRIHIWEGLMYILLYILFVIKSVGFF